MKKVAKGQAGFTLIELIMVIVILGILAVAATSKYQDLRVEAVNATLHGIAAEIAAGSKINLAKRSVNASAGYAVTGCNEANITNLLQEGTLPPGFSITDTSTCSGGIASCNVTESKTGQSLKAEVTILCIN